MILTTTNSVEGRKIIKYLDPVSKSVVLGTNVIADIGASFTDFFGGRSGNYESRLQAINEGALEMLKKHCIKLKANAVVGINIDVGEVSGEGKNMLMVTVVGTPVVLDKEDVELSGNTLDNHILVNHKLRAKRIIDSRRTIDRLTQDDIDFIITSGLEEFLPIVKAGLESIKTCDPLDKDDLEKLLRNVMNLFDNIDTTIAAETMYSWLVEDDIPYLSKSILSDSIIDFDLVDYNRASALIHSDDLIIQKIGLEILNQDKSTYSESDIETMNLMQGDAILKLFEQADLREEKGLMGTKIRWGCICGNKNSEKDTNCSCGRDRMGFFAKDVTPARVQSNINDKVEFIKQLI